MKKYVAAWFLVVVTAIAHADENKCYRFPNDWSIQHGMSVKSVENESLDRLREDKGENVPQVPFGFVNWRWEKLKSQLNESRELVKFSSPKATWEALAGREGYAVIEDGCVIGSFITREN